jgi:hypothetical protein
VFTVNPSLSQLTASGDVAVSFISPQAPGALTTTYSGTINVDLTDTNITFTGGSLVAAQTNGSWQPAVGGIPGSMAADYGGTNTEDIGPGGGGIHPPGNFALRNVIFDLTSPVLTTTNGGFDASSLTCILVTNTATIDYYYAASVGTNSGSEYLNGYAANTFSAGAFISTNAGVRQLTLPVNARFTESVILPRDLDSQITFSGQLVATIAPPIIQSIVLSPPGVVITTTNATAQSVLLVSTNLTSWSPASATLSTNGAGLIVFTTPYSGGNDFYEINDGQALAGSSPPTIESITIAPATVLITAQNATPQSVLMASADMKSWSPVSATLSTNALGMIVFTTPYNAGNVFYRVQQ